MARARSKREQIMDKRIAVIGAGAIGGYTGGLQRKHYLLELEGVTAP